MAKTKKISFTIQHFNHTYVQLNFYRKKRGLIAYHNNALSKLYSKKHFGSHMLCSLTGRFDGLNFIYGDLAKSWSP